MERYYVTKSNGIVEFAMLGRCVYVLQQCPLGGEHLTVYCTSRVVPSSLLQNNKFPTDYNPELCEISGESYFLYPIHLGK